MKKLTLFFLFLSFFFVFAKSTQANIIVISKEGQIFWNVLSSSSGLEIPERSVLEIKDIAAADNFGPTAKVSLAKKDGKVSLSVSEKNQEKSLDVSGLEGSLIEIEERPQTKMIRVGTAGERFTIEEGGYTAMTDYPISINPQNAELSVEAPSGIRYVVVLPSEAVGSLIKAKVANQVEGTGQIFLQEESGKELSYKVMGKRVINVFNLVDFGVPVSAWVSASTGEIVSTDIPTWLKVLGFMFS